LLAARQGGQAARALDLGQTEAVHGLVDAGVGLVSVAGLERGEQFAVGGQILRFGGLLHIAFEGAQVGQRGVGGLLDGVVAGQVERLAQVADAAGGGHRHLAVVRLVHPGDDPEQRGLARTVLAHDPGALTGLDAEGEVVQHGTLAVGLRNAAERKLCSQKDSNRNLCSFKLA